MKEYQIRKNITEADLNRFAADGWEIISVYPVSVKHFRMNEYDITQLGATMCREKNTKDIRNRKKIEEKIKDIVELKFGVSWMGCSHNTTPYELGLDSLDMVDFKMEIEKKFNINIKDDECGDVKSFGDIVELIMSKL